MSRQDKALAALGALALFAFIIFVDYGLETQCPDVAVYVKCYDR